ncbi:MAG TPA: thiolase family protein [Dehalococcoidia bacterium]|nr:thiolase family protein [Dehalococcoidia bacterium]
MQEAVIVSGARTPVGNFGGAFRDVSAGELGGVAIKAAVERAGVNPAQIDDAYMGCVMIWNHDSYVARACTLAAGLPYEVPSTQVNRQCSSGVEAIIIGTHKIEVGDAEIVVAGGTENMSQCPFWVKGARWGYRLGHGVFEDSLVAALHDPFTKLHMGGTAENVAERFGVSREDQDKMALLSHQRAVAAIKGGHFKEQIVPVTVPQPKGEPKVVDTDEHPREDTSLEKLAQLRPAFKEGGTVTAGNSSSINDGAAAVVIMSRRKAEELGIKPRLRLVASAAAGVDPAIMGIGPVPAVRKALKMAGMTMDDIDLIEINEAFAAQVIYCIRELGMDLDKTNVFGSGIALGHPVGATGCIMTIKLMYEMPRRGAKYGLVTMCCGGGQGLAAIFESLC